MCFRTVSDSLLLSFLIFATFSPSTTTSKAGFLFTNVLNLSNSWIDTKKKKEAEIDRNEQRIRRERVRYTEKYVREHWMTLPLLLKLQQGREWSFAGSTNFHYTVPTRQQVSTSTLAAQCAELCFGLNSNMLTYSQWQCLHVEIY